MPTPTQTAQPRRAALTPPEVLPTFEVERGLVVRADRASLRGALRSGLRTRVACAGGCERLEVRALSGKKVLARATTTYAEGRRTLVLRVPRKQRAKLAQRRTLKLLVEATVRDADGRVRVASQRLTLRR